jgi:acetyl esterase/lipase
MNRHDFLKTLAAATAAILVPSWSWSDQPPEAKTFTYKTAGGQDIKLYTYYSDPNVRKPVIVHIHGGALIIGTGKGRGWWLSTGDHVVISIDYRLAPETKLPGIIEDVQDAFRWIHKQGPHLLNIDPEKLIVEGESAGGYLTLMTGFCVKPRPKALISISGYGAIDSPWSTQPSAFYLQQPRVSKDEVYTAPLSTGTSEKTGWHGNFGLYWRQNGLWPQEVTGHNPATEPKWFDRYCPVRNVSAQYPPTVLVHGTADTDVAYQASDEMDKALTRFHVPHKFISIPGGGHVLAGVAESERTRIYTEAFAFAKEYGG